MVFCLALLMLTSKDAHSVWQTQLGRHSSFNVKYNPDVTNNMSGHDSFIQVYLRGNKHTQKPHRLFFFMCACVCENMNHSFFLCLHSFTPNFPPFSPQENISIPACNALWLRCCLYLRKHFCVLLAFFVCVSWLWCECVLYCMLAWVC